MYVRKLTDEEFVELITNKELEIVNAPIRYKDIKADPEKHKQWFQTYSFATVEQYLEWKNFFFEHYYDWKPKRYPKRRIVDTFRYWDLNWGLRCAFDYKDLPK